MHKSLQRLLLALTFCYASASSAQELVWDMGAGMAVFNMHLYPGSADSINYVLPLPYFTLLSKKLEIDKGIRGFLFESEHVVLDVSADIGVPVDSDDSQVRAGMPDLDAVVQIGPSLEFLLTQARKERVNVRFELPLRAVLASDLKHSSHEGWLLEPRFSMDIRRLDKSGLSMKLNLGIKYGTRDYHAYYYDVLPAFSTAARPAYASAQGYGGSFAELSAGWREGDWVWWTLLRYQNLNGAVFEDSPLLEQKDYYLLGFGVAWVFAQNL